MTQSGTSLAEQKCRQRGVDFGWQFRNQYVLSRDSACSYPGWTRRSLAGWVLHHGAALRVGAIMDVNGAEAGFILGHALMPDSSVVEGELRLPIAATHPDFAKTAEEIITALAGRYLAILLTGGRRRVYSDPVSGIPMLYDKGEGKVASSLALILDRPVSGNPDFPARNILNGSQIFGLQHTLDQDVWRGISNHYLDLADFSLHRHWPTPDMDFDAASEAAPEIVDQITARLGAHVAALAKRFDCVFPMSGGRDSRMMLASAISDIGHVKEILGHRFHNPSRRDTKIAKKVLGSLGLPYKIYYKKPTSVAQKRDICLRLGWTVSFRELRSLAMIEDYPQDHLVLRGNIMGLLRAHPWRRDKLGKPLHPMHAIRRLGVMTKDSAKGRDRWMPRYREWFESLPENARHKPYDFAFVELSFPNAVGTHFNGHNRTTFINPFNDRYLIARAISLPAEMRLDGMIVRMMLERTRPDLLEFEFL